MNIIRTERLNLLAPPTEFIELLVANEYVRAGDLLNVIVPDGWPHDEDARAGLSFHLKAIQKNPAELLWRIRLIVLRSNRTVIGSINLKGLPDENGTVEIGWGVNHEYQRQGLAVEASEAVIEWVSSQPKVRRIIATIPADNIASIRMAERLGMKPTGEFRRHLPVWELGVNKAASNNSFNPTPR
jgi:[ribosomal protein S5]-alanine N-acetyltransferase